VNAHEGKAGMVLFAGKTVRSMPERFECTTLAKKALYKYSSLPFLSFPFSQSINQSISQSIKTLKEANLSNSCSFSVNDKLATYAYYRPN